LTERTFNAIFEPNTKTIERTDDHLRHYQNLALAVAILWLMTGGALHLYALDAGGTKTRTSSPPSRDVPQYNRGYLYYNPDIPEETEEIETAHEAPKKVPVPRFIEIEPPKPRVQPSYPRKPPKPEEVIVFVEEPPAPEKPRRPLADKRLLGGDWDERIARLEEENAALQANLDNALKELALALERIRILTDKPSAFKTQTYLVKKGDTLWTIAKKKEVYDDPYKWLLLYHANRDMIYDPNLIFPNTVLLVPRLEEHEKKAK